MPRIIKGTAAQTSFQDSQSLCNIFIFGMAYCVASWCMIKIFRGAGVVTPSNPLPPMNNFCLYPPPVFRCFWKDPLMTPHQPTSSILHCYPLPIHRPFPPPKNFDRTHALDVDYYSRFISLCVMHLLRVAAVLEIREKPGK